jgi:membrane protease YdiL (CAAX protease family)
MSWQAELRYYSALAGGLLIIVLPEFCGILTVPAQRLAASMATLSLFAPSAIGAVSECIRFWFNIILVLLIARYWEQGDFASLGFTPLSVDDLLLGTGFYFFYILMGPLRVKLTLLCSATLAVRHTSPSFFEGWLMAALASDVVFEELATRAYVIERVFSITGSKLAAGVLSLGLSVVMHIEGRTFSDALLRIPLLLLLVALYLMRRSVVACMLCHFLMDAALILVVDHVPPILGRWVIDPRRVWLPLFADLVLYLGFRRLQRSWRPRSAPEAGGAG